MVSSGVLEEEEGKTLEVGSLLRSQVFTTLTASSIGISLMHVLHLGLTHYKIRPYLYQKLLVLEMEDDARGLSARFADPSEAAIALEGKKKVKVKYPLFLVEYLITIDQKQGQHLPKSTERRC